MGYDVDTLARLVGAHINVDSKMRDKQTSKRLNTNFSRSSGDCMKSDKMVDALGKSLQ